MIDIEYIAHALGNGKEHRTPDGWITCCPCHDDNTPSLNLKNTPKGKTLWHDKGGCDQSVVTRKMLDLFPDLIPRQEQNSVVDSRPPGVWPKFRDLIYECHWEYRDEEGRVYGLAVRYSDGTHKKVVPFFEFDGAEWKSKGPKQAADRIFNRDILSKKKSGDLIWVTEGEKCAEAIVRRGGIATTSQGGCKMATKADWNALSDCHVRIFGDNDLPGAGYIESVKTQLMKLTPRPIVEVVDLSTLNLPEGGDVVDWLKAHPRATLSDLENLPLVKDKSSAGSIGAAWTGLLQYEKNGRPSPCDANIILIVQNHDEFKDLLGTNTRTHLCALMRPSAINRTADEFPHEVNDFDFLQMSVWFSTELGMKVPVNKIETLIPGLCHDVNHAKQFDPMYDWFEFQKWDGIRRVDNFLIEFGRAENSVYVKTVASKFLISVVARTYQPGCKVDTMLILQGEQGTFKSSLFSALLPDKKYFSDHLPTIGDKDAYQQIHGLVLLEIAEMQALNKADSTGIKSFISAPVDRYRPSYGRAAQNFPRTCVFCGTTNNDEFLNDPTGARRFWPVAVHGEIDIIGITKIRDQLWAEAVHRYKAGEKWWLDSAEQKVQAEIAEGYRKHGSWEETISLYLRRSYASLPSFSVSDLRFENGRRVWTTLSELFEHSLKIPISRIDRRAEMQLGDALRAIRWAKGRRRRDGGSLVYPYYAPADWHPIKAIDETDNVRQLSAASRPIQQDIPHIGYPHPGCEEY